MVTDAQTFALATDGPIRIYTTVIWPSLWHLNSITLGGNHIIRLYACLQQALLIQPTEDSCLLGAPARALGLCCPTGTPWPQLPCSVRLSEPWAGFGVSLRPPLELQTLPLREEATLKRQEQLCFGDKGPSSLPEGFRQAFPHEVGERVPDPACCSPGEAALPLLSPPGLAQSTGASGKAKY